MTEIEIKQNTETKPVAPVVPTATATETATAPTTSTFTPTPKGDFKKNRRNTFKGKKPKPRSDFESKKYF